MSSLGKAPKTLPTHKRVDGKVAKIHDMNKRIVQFMPKGNSVWSNAPLQFQSSTLSKVQRDQCCPGAEFRWICKACLRPGVHQSGCVNEADVVESASIEKWFSPVPISSSQSSTSASASQDIAVIETLVSVSTFQSQSSVSASVGQTAAADQNHQGSADRVARVLSLSDLSVSSQLEVAMIAKELAEAATVVDPEPNQLQVSNVTASTPIPEHIAASAIAASPSPPLENDTARFSSESLEYVNAFVDYIHKQLPVMYAQEPASGAGSWRSSFNIYSNVFCFPSALELHRHPLLSRFFLSAASFEFAGSRLVVHDPQMFLPEYMPFNGLVCPAGCKVTGSDVSVRLERDGWGPLRVETQAFGQPLTLHLILQLRCRSCSEGGMHHTLYSPDILKQIPPLVRESMMRYRVTSGSIISHDTVSLIEALKLKGLSFEAMQDASAKVQELQRASAELCHFRLHSRQRGKGVDSPSVVQPLLVRSILASAPIAPVISAELAARVLVENAKRQGPFIQAMVAAVADSLEGSLAIDHNFQGKKPNSIGGKAWLHAVDKIGKIVIAKVTEGESLLEALKDFERLAKKLTCVWTDHPTKDAGTLRKMLGNQIRIYGDIFHWLKRVLESVKAGDLKASFALRLSYALLCPVANDIRELQHRLICNGMSSEDAQAKCLDKYYIRNSPAIRFRTLPKAIAIRNLDELLNEYISKDMFLSTFTNVWASLKRKVEGEFYEVHPDDELFINVGTDANPEWFACRGTGNPESWHHVLDKMDIANYGVELQDACYVLLIGSWNHAKDVRVLKKRVMQHTTDLSLLNELVVESNTLVELLAMTEEMRCTLPYSDHKLVAPTEEKIVGIWAGQNATNLSRALTLFSDSGGNESAFPRFKGKKEDLDILCDVVPRDLTSTGRRLIQAMFDSSLFLLKSFRKKLAEEGQNRAQTYALVHSNGVNDSIDLASLTLSFNGHALTAMSMVNEAQNVPNAPTKFSLYGIEMQANDLFPTSPEFVKLHIAQVVKSLVMRTQLPGRYSAQLLPVMLQPPPGSSIGGGMLSLHSHAVSDVRAVIAPLNLAGVDSLSINHEAGYGIDSKRLKTEETAESDDTSTAGRLNLGCAHCPDIKKCTQAHKESCPFWCWQNEPGASKPSRGFNKQLGRAPKNAAEAWRVAYLALSRSARMSICSLYECSLAHEEWI